MVNSLIISIAYKQFVTMELYYIRSNLFKHLWCYFLYFVLSWVSGRKNELKEPLNSNNFSFLQLWKRLTSSENQYSKLRSEVKVTNKDLLLMPSVSVITIKIMILQRVTFWLILKLLNFILKGGVTHDGLRHNTAVGILFIEAWLRGVCSFIIDLNMWLNLCIDKYNYFFVVLFNRCRPLLFQRCRRRLGNCWDIPITGRNNDS